jgi:MFS family permease
MRLDGRRTQDQAAAGPFAGGTAGAPPLQQDASVSGATDAPLYTGRFFRVFAASFLFMAGQSLQYHFGEYVAHLGHPVDTLGWILSLSMLGTLLVRFRIGRWIDRFGCRASWVLGTTVVACGYLAMPFARHLALLVVVRAITYMAVAMVMTTIAVFAAHVAPPRRRAESIGTLGLAGLFGMSIGPMLGDWIFAAPQPSRAAFFIFFAVSAACSLSAGALMAGVRVPVERGAAPIAGIATPEAGASTWALVRRHWPGVVLLIGFVFSMSFCFQASFLERLAEARGFHDIKLFFLTYGPTAIALRVVFRRLPERLGRRRTMLAGMVLLAAGQLVLSTVHSPAGLILPAGLMGAGHAFIWPSMVDLAAGAMPPEHRGLGTSIILGACDVGFLVGFALLGELIRLLDHGPTLVLLASCVILSSMVYTASLARERKTSVPSAI